MSPNNNGSYGGRAIVRRMGPFAFFATVFAFAIPPIGFIMGLSRCLENKQTGESCAGWISIMVISVIMTLIYFVLFLGFLANPTSEEETSSFVSVLLSFVKL